MSECKNCHKTLLKINNKFCSRKCYMKSRIKIHNRVCKTCSITFTLKNINDENRGWGKFCSRKCAATKYNCNENYFENIDTSEKAYWLGMLFSDGNIYKNQLTLKLIKTDEHHLKKFKSAVNSEHPIHQYENYSSFFITSDKICDHLNNLGMIPNKSLIVKYPTIQTKFNKDFIRGIFDGDGCISFMHQNAKYKRWSIFSGSLLFILKLKEIINKDVGIDIKVYQQGKGYYIATSNKKYIQKISTYLYNNSTVYLDRKYNKFSYNE